MFADPYNLIITEPDFTYEGYFDVQFPQNEQFKNSEAAIAYLKPVVEKLTKKKFLLIIIKNIPFVISFD